MVQISNKPNIGSMKSAADDAESAASGGNGYRHCVCHYPLQCPAHPLVSLPCLHHRGDPVYYTGHPSLYLCSGQNMGYRHWSGGGYADQYPGISL